MKYFYIGIAILIVVIGTFATVKKVSPLSWGWWGATNTSEGIALKGYDPVAYFQSDSAVLGSGAHTIEWNDATWHFASAANRDLFKGEPEMYAPQFGGFCSFAASKGFTADSEPDAWHLLDGHLYVFADQNVRDQWVAGLAEGSLEVSERNWMKR
jgi:hypothetical protein